MRQFLRFALVACASVAPACDDSDDHVRDYDDDDDDRTVVVREQPVVVQQQQPIVQDVEYDYPEDRTIVVQQAPPPVIVERIPPPRGPDYFWRPGYHRHVNNRYVWVHGDYVRRRPGFIHVDARWDNSPRGHQYHPGHWRRDGNRHDNNNWNRHDNDRDGRRDGRGDNRGDGRGDNRGNNRGGGRDNDRRGNR